MIVNLIRTGNSELLLISLNPNLAFQFVDKYGEVCPANWQPGSETMVPTTKDSKDYFAKVNQ